MSYVTTYLHHTQAVEEAARRLGVKATVRLFDGTLRLEDGIHEEAWIPKYMANLNGRSVYLPARGAGVTGFAGWMPYELRQWPAATDKITFKRFAIANGMAVPAACFNPKWIAGPFIVKPTASSFGEGIRGPYLSYEPGEPDHQLAQGEYYENFIVGHIAKAWCWGPECIALHLDPPVTVTGDGKSPLRELVAGLPNAQDTAHDWPLISRLAAYSGAAIDDVLPDGKEVLAEFRYGARYAVAQRDANPNLLPRLQGTRLACQFSDAARVCAGSISADPDVCDAFYTLDAIVDSEGQAQFLEMNCNPVVHPDLYGPMMTTRFGGIQHMRRAQFERAALPA
jgi:hypothetical protein